VVMTHSTKKRGLTSRAKRKARLRRKIRGSDLKPRICVFKSDKHTYAQLISDESGRTLVEASTREPDILCRIPAAGVEKDQDGTAARSSKSVAAAKQVGLVIGQRAKEQGFSQVVFDRNGYPYHGRVRAVAEGARQAGLIF